MVYPDLSFEVVGVLFEVFKNEGTGFLEKHYQRAVAEEFRNAGIEFIEQVPVKLEYKDKTVGTYFIDFVVEGKIVVEIKRKKDFSKKNIDQVYGYLKSSGLKLGILANFTEDGVKYKRIVNLE